jgi:aromatic ring-opening dioxygenase catalytic subunit (LigB family)
MEAWLKGFQKMLPAKPKAIVVISAHWEESVVTIQRLAQPNLIYDYYGFPPHTYQLQYSAAGDLGLSDQVVSLLQKAGIPSRIDEHRGYDHGVFVPLLLMFPDADVPVIQVSLKKTLDPKEHLDFGRALAPLRDEGVLILGSGMSYHNLRALFSGLPTAPGSEEFDQWVRTIVAQEPSTRDQALTTWRSAPGGALAHPREEHLMPLMVVAGAAGQDSGALEFSDKMMGAKSSSFSFGRGN